MVALIRAIVYSGSRSYRSEEQIGRKWKTNMGHLNLARKQIELYRNVRARFLLMRGITCSTAHAKGQWRDLKKKKYRPSNNRVHERVRAWDLSTCGITGL